MRQMVKQRTTMTVAPIAIPMIALVPRSKLCSSVFPANPADDPPVVVVSTNWSFDVSVVPGVLAEVVVVVNCGEPKRMSR